MQRDLRQAQKNPTLSDSLSERTPRPSNERNSHKNELNATADTRDAHDRSSRDNAKTTHERSANDRAHSHADESRSARAQRTRERDHGAALHDDAVERDARDESASSVVTIEDESRLDRDDSLNESTNESCAPSATSAAPVEVVKHDEGSSTSTADDSIEGDAVRGPSTNPALAASLTASASSITAQSFTQGSLSATSVTADAAMATDVESASTLSSSTAIAATDGDASLANTRQTATKLAESAGFLTEAALATPATLTSMDANLDDLAASDAHSSIEGVSNTRRRDASNAGTTGEHARRAAATNNASHATVDPLARLIESAQLSLRESNLSAPSSAAVSGRLAQVESEIARGRVAQEIASGALSIEAADESSSGSGAPSPVLAGAASSATLNAQAASTNAQTSAAVVGMPLIASVDGATSAASTLPTDLSSSNPFDTPAAAKLAAKGAEILANQRGGTITMRMEPPALGQLRIELRISHGAVVADFTAATPEARALLEANLGMLRERLESQGLSVERISVHGGSRGTDASSTPLAQGGSESRQEGADNRDRSERASTRQDAAGGESRGRRDDAHDGRKRTDALAVDDAKERKGTSRGFAGVLHGVADARAAHAPRRAS